MNVKLLTDADAKPVLLNLIRTCDDIYIAVAWAGKNSVVDKLILHKGKLRKVVIGTHMYQTNPLVLRQLMPLSRAKCMPPDGRLFHPKVYLFKTGVRVSALVGSHNLTASAFEGDNIEASTIVEGDAKENVFRNLLLYVKKAWDRAEAIDEDFLFPYEKQYEANKAKRKLLTTFNRIKKPGAGAKIPSPLEITWTAFASKVSRDRALTTRLRVLDGVATLFRSKPSFAQMSREERQAIAGTYPVTEKALVNLSWRYFGSMLGHGDFQNLVNETPRRLSHALDSIPLSGEIQRRDYHSFVQLFQRAFKEKAHKGQVATASRLLAMKRPDVFVCISSANRRGLCNAFGVAHTTLSLAKYWEQIVVPIQLSPWWRQDRPSTRLGRNIWDNRAALLDCIYYDPSSKAKRAEQDDSAAGGRGMTATSPRKLAQSSKGNPDESEILRMSLYDTVVVATNKMTRRGTFFKLVQERAAKPIVLRDLIRLLVQIYLPPTSKKDPNMVIRVRTKDALTQLGYLQEVRK